MKAFENFNEIQKLDNDQERKRAWLKQYEGKKFSIGKNRRDLILWKQNEEQYVYFDSRWDEKVKTTKKTEIPISEINKIQRNDSIFVIEFDDTIKGVNLKDKSRIASNIEKVKSLLEENNVGYIESTHCGNSNYIWIEHEDKLNDKDIEMIIKIIAPKDSEVDTNFASSNKRFPVLFAKHWKYDKVETPLKFFEGNKLNMEVIKKIVEVKGNITGEDINDNGYKTFHKKEVIQKIQFFRNKLDLAEQIFNIQPYFFDKSRSWWLWNSLLYKWEIVDEDDILNLVSYKSTADTISTKEKSEIINSMKQFGRRKIPKKIKKTWIQFQDEIWDIKTTEKFKVSPEYFVTNPISYKVSGLSDTPNMDRIFEEWVGKEYVNTLYEIIAYCILPDYPINRLFCFIGEGSNGKSCFLKLLKKFIGEMNVTATELDTLISSRFEVTKLYKKLVCIMGETNFSEMSKTSIIKKLTGQDTISFEHKNKTPFDDVNYAKILIATNNLPTTTDKTTGFYRRWLIIDFPNKFSEKKEILYEIPEEEYSNLATNCIIKLKELLEKREFEKEGSIEERTKKYEDHSDPLEKFMKEFTEEDFNNNIWKFEFEKSLNEWCSENRFRKMSEVAIGKKMKEKNIESIQKQSDWLIDGQKKQLRAWSGIKWKGK